MNDQITTLLLEISNALLIPVVLLLLVFFATTIAWAGGLLAEATLRWRHRKAFACSVLSLHGRKDTPGDWHAISAEFGLPRLAKAQIGQGRDSEKMLNDLQLLSERILGRLNLGVRLGPVLGLAGTLIPLGPALLALSGGDIASLSSRLVVAFSTTVLGLIVGGACFAMHSVRRHWYMQDLNDIEFVVQRMNPPCER